MRRALVCLFFSLLATVAHAPIASASADENSPVLESLTLTPALVDARTEPAEVSFEARITDDSSGFDFGYVSTQETRKTGSFTRISGTPQDGIYRATIPWSSYDANGDIHLSVTLLDAAGKIGYYGSAELIAAGMPDTFQAQTNPDDTAPVLESLTVTPSGFDTRCGSAAMTFEARITDDSSGFDFGYVSTQETRKTGSFTRISGTPQDGIYRATIPWYSYDASGDIHLSVTLLDAAGKIGYYGSAELIAAGMPDHVTNGNASQSPCAPTAPKAVRGSDSATVSWDPPIDDRGSPVTSYKVTSYPDGITQTVDATQTTAAMTGLTNGTSYRFRVTATNAIGTSTRSAATNPVVLGAKPGAPTNASASKGDQSATVTWTTPTSDGGAPITSFKVTSYPDGITQTVDATQTTATVTGLTNGTTYRFRVTATNGVGTGPSSTPTKPVTPGAKPGAPTNARAAKGDQSATVTWTAPTSDGGAPITSYKVTSYPDGITQTVDATQTTATVTGLTNGTSYRFRVTATNRLGTSTSSEATNAVIPSATAALLGAHT